MRRSNNVVKAAQVMNHVLKQEGFDSRVYDSCFVNIRSLPKEWREQMRLRDTIATAPFVMPFTLRENPAFWQMQFSPNRPDLYAAYNRNHAGILIAVEGIDGVGKTTICKEIKKIILEMTAGRQTVMNTSALSENSTKLGRAIGKILTGYEYDPSSITEAMLILAARRDNLEHIILPSLACGWWVVSDRHLDSLSVYQNRGDDHGLKERMLMEQYELNMPADITFVLDLPPDHPRRANVGLIDRMENKDGDFWEYARAKFLDIANRNPRHKIIDAQLTIDQINCIIKNHLNDYFFEKRKDNDQT
ncbi:MAG: dTMP kinase [Gammaproteobacteria bacterium AqS3]|nr:dTMP kinase [Gammaproteobacteria bacterium AqS3]